MKQAQKIIRSSGIKKLQALIVRSFHNGARQNCKWESIFVFALFLALSCLYYRDTFYNWFFYDDAPALYYATEPLKEIFFHIYYSISFYTPLVAISFRPDVHWFGINPLPYHIHNMIVLVLVTFMVYKILRIYADRTGSFLSAIIVLFSTPSLVCVSWLVLRQYLYPMFFSLAAVYLLLKYKPDFKDNKKTVWIILFLSELSFMGKEQYMTLPFVLFILSEGSFRKRLFQTYPYFILLAGHFLLRTYVLGGLGAYWGLNYDLWAYLRTTIDSVGKTSEVLFGSKWLSVIIALPLLKRPRIIIIALLIWLLSLSISFFSMSLYPHADQYRYWFIPVVLFSFLIGMNSRMIKDPALKSCYFLVIALLFSLNSYQVNKEMKRFFNKESSIAERVSKTIVDRKYRESLILYPEDFYLVHSPYVENMVKVYKRIAGIEQVASFFPLELLASYPEITSDFDDVYEVKDDKIFNVTDSIEGRLYFFRKALLRSRPDLQLFRGDGKIELSLHCESAPAEIMAYKKLSGSISCSRQMLPVFKRMNLRPVLELTGSRDARIVDIAKLSFHEKKWYLQGRPVSDENIFLIVTCINERGESTLPSNILLLCPDRCDNIPCIDRKHPIDEHE